MNALFLSIDSLTRDFLDIYGGSVEFDVQTPNLDRFAARALTFDNHYAGSLPCMPARREFLAGVQEFLWRPWGPIEPFDQTLPRLANEQGAVTQLITDHYHYFEHGSHGYFTDYEGWTLIRGHEGDHWRTSPIDPDPVLLRQVHAVDAGGNPIGAGRDARMRARYARNVSGFVDECDFFPAKVFSGAREWLERNHAWPTWFLYIDSFDVHEPFHCPEPYASMYTDEDPRDPELVVWPFYGRVDQGRSALTPRQLAFVRAQFAGKITMVDRWFGEVLDALDRLDLWRSTMVVVTTDHGHYLGEHGWVGKPRAPLYNTLAKTPLLIWHPDNPTPGRRTNALTSAVDLNATIAAALDAPDAGPHSRSLLPLIRDERQDHRAWALYGYWGTSVNITDGRYTYLHPNREGVPATVTSTMLMNPYPRQYDPPAPPTGAESGHFLPYADVPAWRFSAPSAMRNAGPLLFDTVNDPGQDENLAGAAAGETGRMRELLITALRELQAPTDLYSRLDLD